jgi:hypothetical protein
MIAKLGRVAVFGQVPKTHRSKTLSNRARKKCKGPFERPRKREREGNGWSYHGRRQGRRSCDSQRFAKPDVDIFIAYRNDETAATASNEIAALGARPYATKADVTFLASPETSMI